MYQIDWYRRTHQIGERIEGSKIFSIAHSLGVALAHHLQHIVVEI